MLPSVNLSADFNSQDTKKQISALKSQMASLRDAVEDELMNIGYDQLDANLKKKIDSIKEDLTRVSDESIMAVSSLKANYIDAAMADIATIKSNYVTTSVLSAQIANLGTVYASQAWVGALDAVVANLRDVHIANLEADHVSVASFNALNATVGTINANYITASAVSASSIAGKFNSYANGLTITTQNLRAQTIQRWYGNKYETLVKTILTYDGASIAFATWS